MLWHAVRTYEIFQRAIQGLSNYLYLVINLACISIPFIASFYPKHPFFKQWRNFFLANFLMAAFFLIWDAIFTHLGVWGFNPRYLTGIYILNLPIEEILFFVCIPYACVFTYYAFEYLFKEKDRIGFSNLMDWLFILIAASFIILGYDQLYTFYTGLFTCIFMMLVRRQKKDRALAYMSYFAIIPFFLLSNGLLTGSFIEEQVVWYNDSENFGIRMFTIPIEDSIYGFLMIMMNIVLFDHFRAK